MTTEIKEEKKLEKKPEKKKSIWSEEERENGRIEHGCEILIENGSREDVSTKKAPTDAFIVQYVHADKVCSDLTRGSRTSVFDMYYDKFKMELKKIDYGMGTIKPNLWGYKAPQKKKRK